MKQELTCIVCPMGCQIKIEIEGNQVVSMVGNTCQRGADYAVTECFDPRRVLTTTVRMADGSLLPVKTDKAVPKEMLFACMEAINRLHPSARKYQIGDCICPNLLDTGANVVAAANWNRK